MSGNVFSLFSGHVVLMTAESTTFSLRASPDKRSTEALPANPPAQRPRNIGMLNPGNLVDPKYTVGTAIRKRYLAPA